MDLHSLYNSSGNSVHDLFDNREEGFFVPIYQREYTWEEENINRLFEDLILGVRELTGDDGDYTTTFLGTTILTSLEDKHVTVNEGDVRAQPTAVKLVVDGQQRIATIALLSIQLTEFLKELHTRLPSSPPYDILKSQAHDLRETLKQLYALRLGRGANPADKPKIIREAEDRWEFTGANNSYQSPISRYIATYISTQDPDAALGSIDRSKGARTIGNVRLIRNWLQDICDAHFPNSDQMFPVGAAISTDRIQDYVLGFHNAKVGQAVKNVNTDRGSPEYASAAIYQLFLFAYYLLRRCGVNRLQPTRQEWGFDMFQALNSTGTPLTAMETFVPEVMATQPHDVRWQDTAAKGFLDDVEELFEQTTSNQQKNRRTNELLRATRLCFDGEKLGNGFSAQHKWLREVYRQLPDRDQRNQFLNRLARVSSFFYTAWHMDDENIPHRIRAIESHPEAPLTSMLVQYLRNASSDLSAPVLARFFSQISEDDSLVAEFVEAVKACAAFFTLWRSARSTAGLDDMYRRFFRGSQSQVAVSAHSWQAGTERILSSNLKGYFSDVLSHRGILDRESWIEATERSLVYSDVKTVCKFVLFLAGHDRVPNRQQPGLTSAGTNGVCSLLDLGMWRSSDLRSLEHVAPQSPPEGNAWDPRIYSESKVHDVGNLLLLPSDINNLVDNKSWAAKYLHYCHIGARSQDDLDRLVVQARTRGVVLSRKAIQKLSTVQYNCVVEPVLSLGIDGLWDSEFLDLRTRQIKELAWERLNSWLTV